MNSWLARQPSPHDTDPQLAGETSAEWTGRLLRLGSERGLYRQCSIGWHDECSERHLGEDAQCRCQCHASSLFPLVAYVGQHGRRVRTIGQVAVVLMDAVEWTSDARDEAYELAQHQFATPWVYPVLAD